MFEEVHLVWFFFSFAVISFILIIIRTYVKITTGWCRSYTCLIGKTAIITGGNTGIGYHTALDFAKRGARVILACRNKEKGQSALTNIIEETGNKNVVVKHIDMSSFKSVRDFAEDIIKSEDRLDILVNNAGIFEVGPNAISEDGYGLVMQVNYLSSFLLTHLLLGLMKRTGRSRIVNTSSSTAQIAYGFNPNIISKYPGKHYVYHYSKLCNILFTIELSKRLEGTGITTYCLHPGIVYTDLFRDLKGLIPMCLNLFRGHFFKNCEEGAQTTIYCAVAKGIENYNGGFFQDCRHIPHYRAARVVGLPKELWDLTEKVVQLNPQKLHKI